MSIREGYHKKVSFDTKEELGDKIDKLAAMIDKLTTRDSGRSRQFKPQIHQIRGRGQNRNYNQRNYQNRYRSDNQSNSSDRRQSDKTIVGLDMNKIIEGITLEEPQGTTIDRVVEENTETAIEITDMTEAGTGLEKDHFPETVTTILEKEVQAIIGPGQDQKQVQIGIEFDVISVGNTFTLQRTVPLLEKKRK